MIERGVYNVLEKARETYGVNNQILVCIEELNELACVLAKFPRYENPEQASIELHKKALDEVADVEIILCHVKSIFGLTGEEILTRKEAKLERLGRWLNESNSMRQTTVDREVIEKGSQADDSI